MKRHPALVPLSDDHHQELVQARRLLRASGRSPAERLDAAAAYVAVFFTDTVEHFRREEEGVFPLLAAHGEDDGALLARIQREHMELHGLARVLRAEVAAEDVSAETLQLLGSLLREHVRLEERVLFEEIQRVVPEAKLDRLRE